MPDKKIVGIHNFLFFVEKFFDGTSENCNCCKFFPLRHFGDVLFTPNYSCYNLIVDIIYFCNTSHIGFPSISPDVDLNKYYLDINEVKG